jgi:hypothetical protein
MVNVYHAPIIIFPTKIKDLAFMSHVQMLMITCLRMEHVQSAQITKYLITIRNHAWIQIAKKDKSLLKMVNALIVMLTKQVVMIR